MTALIFAAALIACFGFIIFVLHDLGHEAREAATQPEGRGPMTIRDCAIIVQYDDTVVTKEALLELVEDQKGVLMTSLDYDPYSPGTY